MAKIKKIKGFKGYFVTNSGKVLSEYKGNFKWLKPCKNNNGYLQVNLRNEGKTYTKKAHRLVAETLIPNPENKPCVDHINGDRTDNRMCNLRWCTQQENCSFPLARKNRSEAMKGKRKGKPRPEGAGRQPKEVVQFTKNGEFVAEYASVMDAERQTGVNQGHISRCCRGKLKSTGGYIWKFAS